MTDTTITMENILSQITPVITASFQYVVEVADTIVSHPLFMFTMGFLVVGVCIKFFSAMISR